MGIRAALVGLSLLAVTAVVTTPSPALGQPPDSSYEPDESYVDDPALRDLSLAQARLTQTEDRIAELERLIRADLAEIEQMLIEQEFLDVNAPARALTLAQARNDAREASVSAYLGHGVTAAELNMVDAGSIGDATFRNALVRQFAERINERAYIYAVLSVEADETVEGLSDEIDTVNKRVVANRREVAELRQEVIHHEWVRWIAEIHTEADRIIAERQRHEPSADQWERLRFCESSGDYRARTFFTVDANAFGAYQFEEETWRLNVGGVGNPGEAHPAEQDARARLLYAKRGPQPWPFCGRHLRPGA